MHKAADWSSRGMLHVQCRIFRWRWNKVEHKKDVWVEIGIKIDSCRALGAVWPTWSTLTITVEWGLGIRLLLRCAYSLSLIPRPSITANVVEGLVNSYVEWRQADIGRRGLSRRAYTSTALHLRVNSYCQLCTNKYTAVTCKKVTAHGNYMHTVVSEIPGILGN